MKEDRVYLIPRRGQMENEFLSTSFFFFFVLVLVMDRGSDKKYPRLSTFSWHLTVLLWDGSFRSRLKDVRTVLSRYPRPNVRTLAVCGVEPPGDRPFTTAKHPAYPLPFVFLGSARTRLDTTSTLGWSTKWSGKRTLLYDTEIHLSVSFLSAIIAPKNHSAGIENLTPRTRYIQFFVHSHPSAL